ncbi:MAG: hypothetical protein QM784_37140 [Polyangiaceae bacterium]
MVELTYTIAAAFALVIGIPQLLGFLVSRCFRSQSSQRWAWSGAAGLSFATGWWLLWQNPFHRYVTEGTHRTCGAASALLFLGWFVITPFNIAMGSTTAKILESFKKSPH